MKNMKRKQVYDLTTNAKLQEKCEKINKTCPNFISNSSTLYKDFDIIQLSMSAVHLSNVRITF